MAKVKCDYCGSYINEIDEKCPSCGAVNQAHKRVADGTPKTIEELKTWYKERGLPPEYVTRFFIGQNIKAPKVFGIYEENGMFIVYKNKSDGTRVIRYQGTDEAYAVTELYLRLKEEILNQKSLNLEKRRFGNRPGPSVYNYDPPKRRTSKLKMVLLTVMLSCVFVPTILTSLFTVLDLAFYIGRDRGYYVTNTSDVYYSDGREYDKGYEWWFYDQQDDMWELYKTFDRQKQKPAALSDESNYTLYDSFLDVKQHLGIESDKFPIDNAKEYIDAGHHKNPDSKYYYYDNKLYYFIDDEHSDYGSTDNTGWYVYNTNSSEWDYYCGADEKDKIGDELWYNESDYRAGSSIDSLYNGEDYVAQWNPSDFESTSWYRSYESNESAYQNHLEEDNNSYDSDSDYDWDSGDSWDSGGTDWDSDW